MKVHVKTPGALRTSRVYHTLTPTAILLLLGLFIFINSSFAQDIEDLKKGVVKITATTFEEKRKVGTGFIIRLEEDAVYIVTASHVVEGTQDIEVEFFTQRNRLIPAEVIRMEGGDPQGLAVLLIGENIPSDLSALKLTGSVPVQGGKSVTTIGFRRVSYVSWGVIQGNIVGQEGRTIIFSGPVAEGNSGGPLMKEGQVIGVITEVRGNLTYAIPTMIVQYVLEGWGVDTNQLVTGQEKHDPVSGIDFVWVTEGCFQMGSPKSEPGRDSDEGPVHEVCLDGFWMGKYEVTQTQWTRIMGNNPSSFQGQIRPVEKVSWNDVQEFLQTLNLQARKEIYRLPTEAEWEYAARADTQTAYSFDDDPDRLDEYTWYFGNSDDKTHPVGQLRPNAWGLCEMHGNVWEWCQDWYDSEYYAKSPKEDPQGPSSGEYRVLRGGSWRDNPDRCRSTNRFRVGPGYWSYHSDLFGFRVAVGSGAWTQ